MSVLPAAGRSSVAAAHHDGDNRETFQKFYECWIGEQNQYLQELISASKDENTTPKSCQELIHRVLEHHGHYYQAKSRWAKQDVLAILSPCPSWRSPLEDAFLWIGGWRPTAAFHLLYSKSGLQLEAQLPELLRGFRRGSGDLGDLSPDQLIQVDAFQRSTIAEEKMLTEKLAKHQETVADASMVELSHELSEMIRMRTTSDDDGGRGQGRGRQQQLEDIVDSTLALKVEGLEELLQKADDLRLKTLEGVIHILTPIQALHFLIAAAELHLRFHDWGRNRDQRPATH